MKTDYTLLWNSSCGFVLVNNKTMDEIPLSDAEAFRWSTKFNVSVAGSADKRMDEVLGFETFGRRWKQNGTTI